MDQKWEQGPRGLRLTINGLQQWSAYDASREARRWVESLALPQQATLFLAGDAGGHLQAAASDLLPEVRVVHMVPSLAPDGTDSDWVWWPGKQDLRTFLGAVLARTGPADCHWAVWPAFERAAPEESLAWAQAFRDVYRTVQGSWLTWKHSGRQWWRNAERNARRWSNAVELIRGERPIVVVASGPSVDAGWDVLRAIRPDVHLWALPSSFQALNLRGLTPDVAVCTDGGYWAKEHLQRLAGTDTVVLAALSSASDAVLEAHRTLFFGQGLPWERWLLERWPGRVSDVPAQGTVAVTALQWALAATTGPVLVAGLDLCFWDFRAHAQGHTVERRLAGEITRLRPWETQWGERTWDQASVRLSGGKRTSPAMRTYAGWLGTPGRWPRPPYRIAPTDVEVAGMLPCPWNNIAEVVRGGSQKPPIRWSAPAAAWPDAAHRDELSRKARREFRRALMEGSFSRPDLERWAETLAPSGLARELGRSKNPRVSHFDADALTQDLLAAFDGLFDTDQAEAP